MKIGWEKGRVGKLSRGDYSSGIVLEESLETSETATVLSRERMIKEVPL